jgi:hypothetical protein
MVSLDLTEAQIARIKQNADYATTCLTVVTIHVYPRTGDAFTIEAMPWKWLDTAKRMSELRDIVRMFATHTTLQPESWWCWDRKPIRGRKALAA